VADYSGAAKLSGPAARYVQPTVALASGRRNIGEHILIFNGIGTCCGQRDRVESERIAKTDPTTPEDDKLYVGRPESYCDLLKLEGFCCHIFTYNHR
jgi:hypothetical protein